MKLAYRIALFCGAFPLLVGVSIYILWIITRWDWLVLAGCFTLYGGVVIFSIGVLALGSFCYLAFRTPNLPRRRLWLSTFACLGLLLLNLPVAGGVAVSAIAIMTRYTVVIYNASQHPLNDVRVFGGGCDESLGTIPPGGIVQEAFRIQHDGTLEFRSRSGTTVYAKTIDGYVTSNMGGHTTVTINPDGTISVSNND